MIKSQRQQTIVLLGCYLVLAIILTWPTALQLTTHLPGDGGDDPAIAWNLWWVKYALLNEGQSPFQSDFMFYPVGINLAFYTLTVLNGLTVLPLSLNLGIIAASNLHMLFTFIIGGYGTFLLTRYALTLSFTTDKIPDYGQDKAHHNLIWFSAAIAGAFYAFASSKLFYVALGQFNIASNHWIPLAVLYIIRAHGRPQQLKNAALAALFLIFQAWAEMTYASFLLVFVGLYWFYGLILNLFQQQASWQEALAHLKVALVILTTFTLGLIPILAYMLPDMLTEGDFFVEGEGFAGDYSADLFGFVIPTMHHPILGQLISQTRINDFDKGQHIYIGLILLGLMLLALIRGYRSSRLMFWLFAAVVFAALSLGPIIMINGYHTDLKGPFIIFQYLPFFKGNRYPSRYSVLLILSLSVLAAFALFQIGVWVKQLTPKRQIWAYLALGSLAILFVFEHLSLPLPQSNMQTPAGYDLIEADSDSFTLLDIPFAWRNGFRITGAFTNQFMFGQFYQSKHQKRLLQGNTSRNPAFKFQYFTTAPLINSLLALETGKTLPLEQRLADKNIAVQVLHFFDIKYIIVRPNQDGNLSVTPQATIPYIEDVLPVEKIYNQPTLKIYRVNTPPALNSAYHIKPDSPLAPLYFGEGWGLLSKNHPFMAQRKSVRLLLPLTLKTRQITLRMRLPDIAAAHTRSVTLALNGWQSEPQQISTTWQEYTFTLPPNVIQAGVNNLYLHFEAVTSLVPLNSATPLLDVTVLSAGKEVGDFGHIFVNGYDISLHQRGYNLAFIQPQNKESNYNVEFFDTHDDLLASPKLAARLTGQEWSEDTIIALTVADEASRQLSEEAVQAIQSMGATGDLRDCFRCSHAFIRYNGNVLESLNPIKPVGLTTHLGLTEPGVAAQVDWILVEPIE